MKELTCLLIRHGLTKGNIEKRYVGCRTDEELCEKGIAKLRESSLIDSAISFGPKVYVSPMVRCVQTADIILPDKEQVIVDNFREMDFGEFENMNYQELSDNRDYQEWIDSNGSIPFPGGEKKSDFIKRNIVAFKNILAEENVCMDVIIPFIIHGGSIMAIMSMLTGGEYFDYQISCGDAYRVRLEIDEDRINVISYDCLFGRGDS